MRSAWDGGVPEEGAVAHEEGGAAEVADAAEGVAEVGVESGLATAAEGEDVGGFAFGEPGVELGEDGVEGDVVAPLKGGVRRGAELAEDAVVATGLHGHQIDAQTAAIPPRRNRSEDVHGQ